MIFSLDKFEPTESQRPKSPGFPKVEKDSIELWILPNQQAQVFCICNLLLHQ